MLIQAVDAYLSLRRALGFGLKAHGRMLHNYARYATERGDSYVRTDRVLEWSALAPSQCQRERRLRIVACFAMHARAENIAHEVPPKGAFTSNLQNRRLPYIYSPDEIRRLLIAAKQLGPSGSLRPHTYETLFGLLACSGMRISEALALRFDDLTADGLVVRKTKFRKSRLVPLHSTTRSALARYLERRSRLSIVDDHIFVSLRCRPLHYHTAAGTFRNLIRAACIHSERNSRTPSIHDMRHTFAVRALELCSEERKRVGRHILALSTYLGHANVNNTYWYLHATPSLMKNLADACESLIGGSTP